MILKLSDANFLFLTFGRFREEVSVLKNLAKKFLLNIFEYFYPHFNKGWLLPSIQ
jgi:hypothetical protein